MENQATETRVLMHTNKGDIKLKLYNDTPLHRDNFIKLVKEGQYNGLLFHRVIKDFMIQGGDVTSKDAPMNKQLGAGDLGYTVPAEFRYPKYFHKKGALCAARTGDEVNPEILVGVECHVIPEYGFQEIKERTLARVPLFRYQQEYGKFL